MVQRVVQQAAQQALVLVAGPTDEPSWWRDVAQRIRVGGIVVAPRISTSGPPHAAAWIAATAQALHVDSDTRQVRSIVLAGHGTAGPLLPALARTQRAAGRAIAHYVFVDATLPRPGQATHLDLLRAADPAAADLAHTALHESGTTWPPLAGRPGDHDFWTEPLPPPGDWPDAPCVYLRTGADVPECGDTAFWARSARARGWTVDDPVSGIDALATSLARLGG